MYTHRLSFVVERVLRGQLQAGERLTLSHVARQEAEPTFPRGQVCLVAASTVFGGRQAARVVKAEPALVAEVAQACALPLGWKMADGKPVSPWAPLGRGAWPAGVGNLGATTVCATSGRPALTCGDGVTLSVAPVPPKKAIQWTNPDGDGEYRLTVKNTTDKPVTVPALLTDGESVLWANSVVVLCQGKAYYLPAYRVTGTKREPAKLAPGQEVSGVVDPLALVGPEWPQGGYRIGFQFCLGEKSVAHEFYYMSRHHDPLRAALPKVKPGEISWDEMKALIKSGPVQHASQTHAREVDVTMADGRTYRAISPRIDEVVGLLRETGRPLPPIAME
jgi:hypothetical protein